MEVRRNKAKKEKAKGDLEEQKQRMGIMTQKQKERKGILGPASHSCPPEVQSMYKCSPVTIQYKTDFLERYDVFKREEDDFMRGTGHGRSDKQKEKDWEAMIKNKAIIWKTGQKLAPAAVIGKESSLMNSMKLTLILNLTPMEGDGDHEKDAA